MGPSGEAEAPARITPRAATARRTPTKPLAVPFQQVLGECFEGHRFSTERIKRGERFCGESLRDLPRFLEADDGGVGRFLGGDC